MVKEILLLSMLLFSNNKYQDHSPSPLILFEFVFNGSGDDIQIHGQTIDGKGVVHCFNARNDTGLKFSDWNYGKWDYETQYSEMTPSEIITNLGLCDSVMGTIDRDTLLKYVDLFSLIAKSNSGLTDCTIVKTKNKTSATSGTTSVYGFVYDADRNIYKRILILKYGDAQQQNNSPHVNDFKHWTWCR